MKRTDLKDFLLAGSVGGVLSGTLIAAIVNFGIFTYGHLTGQPHPMERR